MDILPIFLLRLGSSLLIWMASLASCVIWEGSLSMMLKSVMEGKGWWKSLQCLSMGEVVVVVFSDFKYLFLRFVYVTYVYNVFVFAFIFNASFNFAYLRLEFINYLLHCLTRLFKIDL